MGHTVIMPKLGQTVEESTILKWHKQAGDQVKKGEVLFEIETDKAVLDVESFVEGTLLKIFVQEGETVPVTAPVAFIGQPGEPIPEITPVKPDIRPEPARHAPTAQIERVVADRSKPSPLSGPMPAPAPARPGHKAISPRARQLAKDHAISPEPIAGTGPGGRITEKDIVQYLAAKKYDELRITPAAKALARKEGIDILSVATGNAGRKISPGKISLEDIELALAEKPKEMTRIRQIIAQRLAQSFSTIPHFYVTVSVDMTDLLELRKKLKKEKKPYSVTDFILKASALALKAFPDVNGATDGKTIRRYSRVHLGLAVDIKEGLVVPVIRNADTISLAELHQQAMALVLKAREGKLTPGEMTGSTFTVSNMGMLDVENFTAIINPGESAILAVASILSVPQVVGAKIKARSLMKLTVSADHRLVDGVMAARFVNRIKKMLEDPKSWTSMI